ncbi:MAG: hypothetical protein J6T10_29295 [Methanobrevibacter sp.]|nr:hypothetical protein [Methanobrevibacter sp.]
MAKDNYSKIRSFMAKNAPTKGTAKELKDEADKLYEKKLAEDTQLLEAYNNKKLKSKSAIKKAKTIAQKYDN